MKADVFSLLQAEASKYGLPLTFGTDLTVHDKRALATNLAGKAFVWVLYECGTHMAELFKGHWPDGPIAVLRQWDSRARFYTYSQEAGLVYHVTREAAVQACIDFTQG